MTIKNYALITGILFSLFALVHVWRLYTETAITIGDSVIPMGVSWVGMIVGAALGFFGLRISAGK
jgi:hypothetical protein